MTELKGSEKQVKWANEIRANIIKEAVDSLNFLRGKLAELEVKAPELAEKSRPAIAAGEAAIADLGAVEKAVDWIENRNQIAFPNFFRTYAASGFAKAWGR